MDIIERILNVFYWDFIKIGEGSLKRERVEFVIKGDFFCGYNLNDSKNWFCGFFIFKIFEVF